MADEQRRFSLEAVREAVGSATASLSPRAASKSVDGSDAQDMRRPFSFEMPDYDRTEAPKDEMRKYWRQFETTPIIRKPITSFASRVTEPGYFIETPDLTEDEVRRIGDWLNQCAILEGQPGKDFRLLAKKAIVQREVRGTALVEVAPDKFNDERVAGLKLINPETMEAVTRPNQTILMAPDDIDDYPDAPLAESGGAAAWLQDILETDQTYWGTAFNRKDADNDAKIGFRRDEIIPLARDADVGEVFGTSRIEAVSDRIDGIKQKLSDNDEAIASKAYPLYLFLFGSEERPWDSRDIQQFMKAHEMENFHPGMKQGVRGDVEVTTISGEVADIAEYLNFDIRWIMSAMPMPMFVLGSFMSATVGQVAGIAQQQDINRQIKEARRELEEEFTPVVRKVAMQQGIDEERVKRLFIKFGKPGETDLDLDRNEQVIRYIGLGNEGDSQGQRPDQRNMQQRTGQVNPAQAPAEDTDSEETPDNDKDDGIITTGETPETIDNPTPDLPIAGVDEDANPYVDYEMNSSSRSSHVWSTGTSVDELQYGDGMEAMSSLIYETMASARDNTLEGLEQRYHDTPEFAIAEFETVANREMNRAISDSSLTKASKNYVEHLIDAECGDYGRPNKYTDRMSTRFYVQNMENAVRDATEEMLRRARLQARRAVVSGEPWSVVRRRVVEDYNDTYLRDRANLIAYMESKETVETEKLRRFEQHEDIIGYRIENVSQSTPVTRSLNGVEVMFDDDTDATELMNDVAGDVAVKGFDPLPLVPPYHFNDTSELVPIYKE